MGGEVKVHRGRRFCVGRARYMCVSGAVGRTESEEKAALTAHLMSSWLEAAGSTVVSSRGSLVKTSRA